MVPSVAFVFLTFFALSHCSTIPDQPQTKPSSETPEVPSSTGQPDGTTRGPHTHDEHPVNDPDHSDHDHPGHDHSKHDHSSDDHSDHGDVEEPKAAKADEEDHEHPGHDHSATGHDHKDDHPEEVVEAEKPSPSEESKKDEVPKEEGSEKRAKRALWRRRLD